MIFSIVDGIHRSLGWVGLFLCMWGGWLVLKLAAECVFWLIDMIEGE